MRQAIARKKTRATPRRNGFRAPPVPHHNMIAAGIRAFFEIANKWDLSYEEGSTLLGQPSKSTFYNWRKGDVGDVVHGMDLSTRISYVLGIFQALEILYQQHEMADAWVRKPNDVFGGHSALDRMLAGQITDLADVRQYLDSVTA
jgi:Protein of unknown function (DUF2384)